MDLRDGLEIRENLIIKWDYSFDEVKFICEANNIDFDCETTYCGTKYELKEITLYLEFANLGNMQAVIYFVKDSITEIGLGVYSGDFSMDRFLWLDNKLKLYFGEPQIHTKRKSVWKFKNTRLKHYYITIEDYQVEYLELERRRKLSWLKYIIL